MTIEQQLRHPRADKRVEAKRKAEMLARLRAELTAKAWWV